MEAVLQGVKAQFLHKGTVNELHSRSAESGSTLYNIGN